MELKNAKINFLGDSITEGCGTSGEHARFSNLIAEKYGLGVMRNYGIGGTRFARQDNVLGDPRWELDFCKRALEMDEDADAVVVFGGTNDFGHGSAPIGSFEDRTPYTFYGACHTLMTSLIERYPGKPIVFLTPLHRFNEDCAGGDIGKEAGATLVTYVNIIKEVAAHYSLPVLDLWSVSGLQCRVDVIREKFVPDGLHPNDAGHVILAERIGNYLSAL
jgi:lysophospholipase L1-like esterase